MEKSVESSFLDKSDMIQTISALVADKLLGREQLPKIILRYRDLKDNFNALTFDECVNATEQSVWRFSSGVTPYKDFDDTSNVPIPITNPLFANKDNIVSYDFPVWFNLQSAQRIVMVTQDPMPRSIEWYGSCRDAICSTAFGIHNASRRNKGNGGMRMWLLIQKLVSSNIGIYLTDCKKFYIQSAEGKHIKEDKNQIEAYADLLQAEIDAVKPTLIVSFGNEAKKYLNTVWKSAEIPIIGVPHFSGQAQAAIRSFFCHNGDTFPVEDQAKCFLEYIINSIK